MAGVYRFSFLEQQCSKYVAKHLSEQSALQILNSGISLGNQDITKKALQIVGENAGKLFKTADVSTNLCYKTMLSVLQTENMNCDEILLFNTCANWIQKNNATPTQVSEIVGSIRFSQIPGNLLLSVVKPSKLVPMETYYESLEFHADPTAFDRNLSKFKPRFKKQVHTYTFSNNSNNWKSFSRLFTVFN